MLYFVGLGLFSEDDISYKGFKALQSVDCIYAEFYTAKLMGGNIDNLIEKLDVPFVTLKREDVEDQNIIIREAMTKNIAFVTAGDSLMATTHTELYVEALNKGIETRIIHGSSIFSAAPGLVGLQAYKFGKTTTVPFPDENFFPHSPYDAIKLNSEVGLHTLVLLDIQAHKDKYMSVNEAIDYLRRVESERGEHVFDDDRIVIGLAQAGSDSPIVKGGTVAQVADFDFGEPLHCMIVPGNLHFIEAEALLTLADVDKSLLEEFL
ncbi:diphthine synthase [Methanosphaera sp. WGK6]|uniref:diphthine synthase n=1 Tax=Methanosphaera sp. WGK6 TaxID=1561964 RepID=UPI00084C41A8|nr:diphthine synthase [Methanosphaera sp. WGK6]OED29595.1 diphthine synthase [Methanosphaera sp. WGK6]